MKSSKIILPVLLAATMIGTAAYSTTVAAMDGKMGMGGCGMMGGSDMDPMMKHMGMGSIPPGMVKHIKGQLKPEQMAQFDAALKEYGKKLDPLQQALFVKHEELKALQHASNPDVKAVSKTATELAQLFSKVKSEREAFEDKIIKDFGIKDLHGGMMGGMMGGGMMGGGMMQGGMMGGMKHDAMSQTPPAAPSDQAPAGQAPAGHEGHK